MGGLAVGDFELDGGVSDLEAIAQGTFDIRQNIAALGHGHFGDGDVAGERMRLRAEAPDMEVVHVEDTIDGGHGLANFAELQVAGRAFEQDIQRLANDAGRTPEDHRGDEDREHWVDPRHASEEDGCAACDDGGGGECVSEHVEEDAADVDVAGRLPEQRGDRAVHQNASRGDVHHQLGLHCDRLAEAMDRGDRNPYREHDEGGGVDECGQNARSLVAEGLLIGGWASLKVDSYEREHDGQQVANVMAGFRDKGQGVSAQTEVEGRSDVCEREQHRELQNTLHLAIRSGDHVHEIKCSLRGG